MAILDIKTKNNDVSWIIKKNPLTQEKEEKPFHRTLRQGNLYAWYMEDSCFRLYFKDGEGKSSFYKKLNNDYLDQSAYNCPYTYCAMISEMLSATIKEKHEKDIEVETSIMLSSILITSPHIAKAFANYFSDKVKIEMTPITKKIFNISFSGNVSLYYLINFVQVFCLIQSLEDRNIYIDMTEGALKKYAKTLVNIEAPYFIVYLFLSRCVPDYASFQLIKDIVEQKNWILNYGNTQKQRFNEIKKLINKGDFLHDLGCGELYYSRNLSEYYDQIYAWDADRNIQERNKKFIVKKELKNIILKDAFTENSINDIKRGSDILITEMLEHMPKLEATKLLKSIKTIPFRRLIITVPNKEFNKYYKLDTEFRHDDHCWEPTFNETVIWIEEIFGKGVTVKPIGDGINGTHVSTLITIERTI